MVADDPGWIEEVFHIPCTYPKGEVVRIVEADSIEEKSQDTNLSIRIVIGMGTSLEKMIMSLFDNLHRK